MNKYPFYCIYFDTRYSVKIPQEFHKSLISSQKNSDRPHGTVIANKKQV